MSGSNESGEWARGRHYIPLSSCAHVDRTEQEKAGVAHSYVKILSLVKADKTKF